jgi:hypothetical protein
MKRTIYLARQGKVFGPISETEWKALEASARHTEYSWIWREGATQWEALDAAPEPIAEGFKGEPIRTAAEPTRPAPAPAYQAPAYQSPAYQPAPPPLMESGPSPMQLGFKAPHGRDIPVVGHNFRQVIGGVLGHLTASGCEFRTEDHGFAPSFVPQSAILLNLLEGSSGHLMNVPARVCGVSRTRDGWIYQLRWEENTQLLYAS